ncbi:MAG: hypothetical protein JNL90_06020 [Planctomycetes bacterium]|nr:hypothetical protein [Planctomycetota bacterium]
MKLLTFQAARFAWKSAVAGLADGADPPADDSSCDAVVVFAHAQLADVEPAARERTMRHAVKHIKWLANKRQLKNVVLHSFTHLGGAAAPADFARAWLTELASKLESGGYAVKLTPFGWSCAWELSVFGESLAKVWKEIGPGDPPLPGAGEFPSPPSEGTAPPSGAGEFPSS